MANSDGGPLFDVELLPGNGKDDGRLVSVDVAMDTAGGGCDGVVQALLDSPVFSNGFSSSPLD